jgi:XTP/dITP diphosphohydrolase
MTAQTDLDLLIATGNAGKAAEIRAVLGDLPIDFRTLEDFPEIKLVQESGCTYEENAILKARYYAQQTGLWALADDSGFAVEALGGAPGIFSARDAGAGASDSVRIAHLLRELGNVTSASRKASFACVVALADSSSTLANVEFGVCEGRIISEPRGGNGFGYDPIFVPRDFHETFAELPMNIKNSISHRAQALHAMRSFLNRLLRLDARRVV